MLNSFKELLARKAHTDGTLKKFIEDIDVEFLTFAVIETLKKMAANTLKGDSANRHVIHFGKHMDEDLHPTMMRDAIGHHVSRYKGALSGGNQQLANRHARQAFKLMNLAATAEKHSEGKMNIEYVDPKPWERQKYLSAHPTQKNKDGSPKYTTDTKGLNYSKKGTDYGFLAGAPNTVVPAYRDEVAAHGHSKAYPFEHVKINGKHIHVDDVSPKGYEEHEFDKHPIMKYFEEPSIERGEGADPNLATGNEKKRNDRHAQYIQEHIDYHSGKGEKNHIADWVNKHKKLMESDKDAYARRGSAPSDPVHKDIPGITAEQPKETSKVAPTEIPSKKTTGGEPPDFSHAHDLFTGKELAQRIMSKKHDAAPTIKGALTRMDTDKFREFMSELVDSKYITKDSVPPELLESISKKLSGR
jgi:hypothetical protein